MVKNRLFHVSEDAGIERLEPRPTPSAGGDNLGDVVWAIDEVHLPNYLLPRECPRVTFAYPSGGRVVAVENDWFERIQKTTLYLYEMPPIKFALLDLGAGYYVSTVGVQPIGVHTVVSALTALIERNVEVRFLPNLWPLRNEVVNSSLEFSVIRFRNAKPMGSP